MPPPKTFADLEEAKSAMRKVLEVLFANQAELQALIVACGDDQQKKMTQLIPALQKVLAVPMQEAGFPAPPMGIMQGVMAFTQAQALPGGECIKDGVDMLKASMMGTFPTDAQLSEMNAKLA